MNILPTYKNTKRYNKEIKEILESIETLENKEEILIDVDEFLNTKDYRTTLIAAFALSLVGAFKIITVANNTTDPFTSGILTNFGGGLFVLAIVIKFGYDYCKKNDEINATNAIEDIKIKCINRCNIN